MSANEKPLALIGKEDGSRFESFLSQPPVKDALARYVYEEARHLLWSSLSPSCYDPYNLNKQPEPTWLTAEEGDGSCKADMAEHALEIALQAEVERRLRLAVEIAEGPAADRSETAVLSLARRTAQVLQRNADALRGIFREEHAGAFAAAGLTATPGRQPQGKRRA